MDLTGVSGFSRMNLAKNRKDACERNHEKSRLIVTTHVVKLKLFRLKGSEKHDCRTLAEKQQIFASNMTSKCAVFPLFLIAFSL